MINSQLAKWNIALAGSLVLSFIFLRDFLMVIALAAVSAHMFYPLYRWYLKRMGNKVGLGATATLLSAFLLFLVPVSVVLTMTVFQTRTLITDIRDDQFMTRIESFTEGAGGLIESISTRIEELMRIEITLNRDSAVQFIQEKGAEILNITVRMITSTVGSVPRFFMYLLVFLYLFIAILVKKDSILRVINGISPFDDRVNKLYWRKVSLMTEAMIRGQLIIACVQGLIGALSLWIVGIDYVLFFAVLLVFLSFIPLGSGIITLPMAFLLLLTGNIWQALIVGLTHLVIVTNIDNVLRAKLVHKDAYIHPALMIVATFAGLGFFGLPGIVFGPLIMILILTTWQLYIEEKGRLLKAK